MGSVDEDVAGDEERAGGQVQLGHIVADAEGDGVGGVGGVGGGADPGGEPADEFAFIRGHGGRV